jgi:ATP-dependent Clp protease ATP-binding subunit ClpA
VSVSPTLSSMSHKVLGQTDAIKAIVPYVRMFEAGLNPVGRPAGVFMLLGPTGTGKTHTAEALAETLHGSSRHVLRIDCGEYQMEHEVAKLIGAPPGYLGHRETHPVLTQARLAAITSQQSSLSIILFDEIEKAAYSMMQILLGVLDKGQLRLGDNNIVNFERSLIFFTSNTGAKGVQEALAGGMGLTKPAVATVDGVVMAAVRKRFSPEFLNRVDAVITYKPLSEDVLKQILNQQLDGLQEHLDSRLGARSFKLIVTPTGREFLLHTGTSQRYGARELKRVIHRYVTQPLSEALLEGRVRAGGTVKVMAEGKVMVAGR